MTERALATFATGGLVATNVSQSITFTDKASIDADSVLVKNAGANAVFLNLFAGTAVAPVNAAAPAPGQTPLLPGEIDLFFKGMGNATVQVVTGASTSQVYVTACKVKL